MMNTTKAICILNAWKIITIEGFKYELSESQVYNVAMASGTCAAWQTEDALITIRSKNNAALTIL